MPVRRISSAFHAWWLLLTAAIDPARCRCVTACLSAITRRVKCSKSSATTTPPGVSNSRWYAITRRARRHSWSTRDAACASPATRTPRRFLRARCGTKPPPIRQSPAACVRRAGIFTASNSAAPTSPISSTRRPSAPIYSRSGRRCGNRAAARAKPATAAAWKRFPLRWITPAMAACPPPTRCRRWRATGKSAGRTGCPSPIPTCPTATRWPPCRMPQTTRCCRARRWQSGTHRTIPPSSSDWPTCSTPPPLNSRRSNNWDSAI